MVRLGRFFPTAILRVLVLAFYAVVAFAASVEAEAITIESGFLSTSVVRDLEPNFVLNGPEFSISGGGGVFVFAMGSPSHIGSPTDLGGRTEVISNSLGCLSCSGPFEVQLKGVTFSEPDFTYSGQFAFSSVIPSSQQGLNSAPFGFTGSLTGFDAATNQEVFSLSLNGGGMATAFLDVPFGDVLFANSVRFDFAPIPEPSAILLVATGLIGLAMYRWRGFREELSQGR
jgi:PEP-CTERM motif-containing protein